MKKTILLSSLLVSALLLVACDQEKTSTSVSSSSSSVTSSSSSKETPGEYITYSDGSQIFYSEGDFVTTLADGTTISSLDSEKSYTVKTAEGDNVAKNADGSYSIVLASGDSISFTSDGTYSISTVDDTTETGTGEENLNKYLTENNYPTISKYYELVKEIRDYIDKQR